MTTTPNASLSMQPLAALTPYAKTGKGTNPRRGNIEAIEASLKRFGQTRPIVVQSDGTIVAGNHTYAAAQRLGWEQILTMQVNFSDAEAQQYLLADNRTTDLATNEDSELLEVLELMQQQGELEGTGYTPDDIDDLLAALDRVNETQVEPFLGDYAESPDVTAARWEERDEGQRKEVVFLLEHEKFDEFKIAVNILKDRYRLDSMALTVYEAVVRAAEGFKSEPDF